MKPKRRQAAGPPIDLGNMRHLGVRGLAVHCLSPKCGHEAVFSADDFPDDLKVVSFQSGMTCGECGGENVDVRPNWKEQSERPMKLRYE
jgi:hypothetical protein